MNTNIAEQKFLILKSHYYDYHIAYLVNGKICLRLYHTKEFNSFSYVSIPFEFKIIKEITHEFD